MLVLLVLAAVRLPGLTDDLTEARTHVEASRSAVADADLPRTRTELQRADLRARHAVDVTGGRVWRLAAGVPVLGRPFGELRALSAATATTTGQVLRPLAALEPAKVWTGRLEAAPFVTARGPLVGAERAVARAQAQLAAAPRSGIRPLTRARERLVGSLGSLGSSVREARVAAEVVPRLVGQDQPVRLFLAVQNPAEPRATGGLLGAYGVLTVDDGRVTLERSGPNTDLRDLPAPVVDLGEDFALRYDRFGARRSWRSANLTPDVPSAARTWVALWKARTGETLDGAVLVDPVALAELLRATGPVTLTDGTRLTARNAVDVLLRDVYARYPRAGDTRRDAYLQEALRRVVGKATRAEVKGPALVRAVRRAVATGHLSLWAQDDQVQSRLRTSAVGGALPGAGPYVRLVVQDAGGSKLGYYLTRSVRYDAKPVGVATDLGGGPRAEEEGTVTVDLASLAPASGLPEYVTIRADAPDGLPRPVGQAKYWVSVYLGPGGTLLEGRLDGRPVPLQTGTEQGLTVVSGFLTLDPGQARRLVLRVRQPT